MHEDLLDPFLAMKQAEALYRAVQEGQYQLQECIQLYIDRTKVCVVPNLTHISEPIPSFMSFYSHKAMRKH